MGPQQSSSPLLPLLFQFRLPLRCAPSIGLWHNVRPVLTAAVRPLASPKTLRLGVAFSVGVLNFLRRRPPWSLFQKSSVSYRVVHCYA